MRDFFTLSRRCSYIFWKGTAITTFVLSSSEVFYLAMDLVLGAVEGLRVSGNVV